MKMKMKNETLTETVEKLEALKQLFETLGVDVSEFDSIIQSVKITQKAIEDHQQEVDDYDEDYLEDMLDDNLPR